MRTAVKRAGQSVPSSDAVTTTCMHLNKALLYLVPYYDLYCLRAAGQQDPQIRSLHKKCLNLYRDQIRHMRKKNRN